MENLENEMIEYFKKCVEDAYNRWFQEWLKLWKEKQSEYEDILF